MTNPFYCFDRAIQVGFNNTLESHHNNRTYSKLNIQRDYLENEMKYVKTFLKEIATMYAKLINQNKIKYQTIIPARFDKQDKDGQVLDEIEL